MKTCLLFIILSERSFQDVSLKTKFRYCIMASQLLKMGFEYFWNPRTWWVPSPTSLKTTYNRPIKKYNIWIKNNDKIFIKETLIDLFKLFIILLIFQQNILVCIHYNINFPIYVKVCLVSV